MWSWGVSSLADNVSQGNYGWAAVDAVGLVVDAAAAVMPVVPGGVGTAIKAYRAADKVEDAVSAAVRYGDNAVKAADEVVAMADEAVEVVTDCINSFSAETEVVTDEGAVAIAEIEVGDWVLGYHEFSGDIAYYPVTHLISHVDEEVVTLTVAGERLVTTAEHPFYTGEGVWVEAGDLQPGDTIRTAMWTTGQVEAVTLATDPQPMYNFTVATAHTYFMGDGAWLVHNACPLRNLVQPQVDNKLLQKNIINEIFRDADQVAGGTAGMLLEEGTKLGAHFGKAKERIVNLQKIIKSGKYKDATLSESDINTLQSIVDDLQDAVNAVSN